MAHRRPATAAGTTIPYWSQMLRALREARGITQEGWAAQLGYSRATVRRWESGKMVPSADAEQAILEICTRKRLFQHFGKETADEVQMTPEWIADVLAKARMQLEIPESTTRSAPVLSVPNVAYASSDNVSIAYQVLGDGPVTLVITPGAVSHREIDWENTSMRTFLLTLAQSMRVIIFDKRGTGMSDRVSPGSIDQRIDDIRAIMDAAGCERAVLVGISEGGPLSIGFAATYPDRVDGLIVYGSTASAVEISPEEELESFERLQQTWGTQNSGFLERFAPSVARDQEAQAWWARYLRLGGSPGAIRDLNTSNSKLDVQSLLPTLTLPTLVVHRLGDRVTPFFHGEAIANQIPGAKLSALSGDDHLPWVGDTSAFTTEILDFVSHLRPGQPVIHRLTTVLCWDTPERDHQHLSNLLRLQPAYLQGQEHQTDDFGTVLTFDSPTHAVLCARELSHAILEKEICFGIGIHTGEVNYSPHKISGIAIATCISLAQMAAPGEVLISSVAADLVSSPDLAFQQCKRAGMSNELGDIRMHTLAPIDSIEKDIGGVK